MGWTERGPRDVNEQFLEYAEQGRLVPLPADARIRSARRNPLAVFITIAALASAGFGAAVALVADGPSRSAALLAGGAVTGIALLAVLIAAGSALNDRAHEHGAILLTPGAVLPPDLLHPGNWFQRAGAWVRIEEIGRDGGGQVSALLSTGEVVLLDSPVTIAGGRYRPVADPLEPLRK